MPLNTELLRRHLHAWKDNLKRDPVRGENDRAERMGRTAYYQAYTAEKIRKMNEEEFYEFIAKLWAMLIWGNKQYVVDKLMQDNGFRKLKDELATLIWGEKPIEHRWDKFRSSVKGMGPAMMSEILCHSRPEEYALWNRRAFVGFHYLGIDDLPRYNYQVSGARYKELSDTAKAIAQEMKNTGISEANLLTVDYFIWDELQVQENLSQIHKDVSTSVELVSNDGQKTNGTSEFLHDDVRDKLADIGSWLGFSATTEVKVAVGSKVDAVWEATIGNMGRVIYVFEVQTKGSIDSLILNLLKSLNNPAVQGVVAVSDAEQIERIKKHADGVPQLKEKLKYWNFEEVLSVHEEFALAYESINRLGLVPEGFVAR